jgi:hypothetical protein
MEPVKLDELSITYKRFAPYSRNQLITGNGLPSRLMSDGTTINANIRFLDYIYWDNSVTGLTDRAEQGGGQYRSIGWQFRLGFQLVKFLQIGYYHHSQHVVDHQSTFRYPLEDAFEAKLIIFKDGSKNGLIEDLISH